MRYLRRHRRVAPEQPLEDPLSGVANLFDASIVFVVSMMIALFMAHNMIDLINPQAEVTVTKRGADGQLEVITRKGKEVKAAKVTDKKLSGEGVRLGTAYRLPDGRIVYVPQ